MVDGNRNDVSGGIDADRPKLAKLLPQLRRSFTTRVAGGSGNDANLASSSR